MQKNSARIGNSTKKTLQIIRYNLAGSYLDYMYLYSELFVAIKWLSKSFSIDLTQSMKANYISTEDFVFIELGLKTTDSPHLLKNARFGRTELSFLISRRVFSSHFIWYYSLNQCFFYAHQTRSALPGSKQKCMAAALAGYEQKIINSEL